jgi:hypothetical protein
LKVLNKLKPVDEVLRLFYVQTQNFHFFVGIVLGYRRQTGAERNAFMRMAKILFVKCTEFNLLFMVVTTGCGESKDSDPAPTPSPLATANPTSNNPVTEEVKDPFPASFLSDFKGWTPVLKNDVSFSSPGHGGATVKSYLNEKARTSADSTTPFPVLVGSVLAKAVLPNASASSSSATRVYFMRKMPAGFDSKNNDWAYSFANLENGSLKFSTGLNAQASCIGCHSQQKNFDYVKTVDIYLKQSVQ